VRGTAFVAPTMALCIGCLRAVSFGDPGAIVWVDVSQTVWRVLAVQLVLGVLVDAIVWAAHKMRPRHFEMSALFAVDHPLLNTAFRDFDLQGYAFVFGMGGMFIYGVFLAFLGPAFVTGMCQTFAPNSTHVWVLRALDCTNATMSAGLVNGTLPAGVARL
jgi:hypothetical protein